MDFFEDVAAVEAAEASIDQFIERRARQNDEANRLEAAWAESERRVIEKRREANRQSWIAYYGHMHRLHLGLAAEHANRRSRLMLEADYEPDEAPGGEAA